MSTCRQFMPRVSVPFLSKLRVGSVLIFPSGDLSAVGQNARGFIKYRIKQDMKLAPEHERGAIELVASRVAEHVVGGTLEEILGKGGVLVPVPRSGLMRQGTLWPSYRICEELRRLGIGSSIEPCIERTVAVKRSSTAAPGERPGVREHYDSFRIKPLLAVPERVVLVDDVVTRGATMVACGTRILEQFPGIELVAFAFGRIEYVKLEKLADMFVPKVETIEYEDRWEAPVRS